MSDHPHPLIHADNAAATAAYAFPKELVQRMVGLLGLPLSVSPAEAADPSAMPAGIFWSLSDWFPVPAVTAVYWDAASHTVTQQRWEPLSGPEPIPSPIPLDQWEAAGPFPEADLALLLPPFGYTRTDSFAQKRRLETLFLTQTARALRPGGRCVALVPNGVLGRTGRADDSLRRLLVNERHLERVILLSPALFPSSEVSTSLLVIDHRLSETDTTAFYDLRDGAAEALSTDWEAISPTAVRTRDELAAAAYRLLPDADPDPAASSIEPDRLRQRRETLRQQWAALAEAPSVLPEDWHGQLRLFEEEDTLSVRRHHTRRRLQLLYDRLDCELALYVQEHPVPTAEGRALFALKNGETCEEKNRSGPYPLYGAGGIYGAANVSNMAEDSAILIGRVGSSCGQVFRAHRQGFVSDNALQVLSISDQLCPDFLFALLQGAHLERHGYGTGQPYITQAVVLDRLYPLPSREQQQDFLRAAAAIFAAIEEEERRLEETDWQLA